MKNAKGSIRFSVLAKAVIVSLMGAAPATSFAADVLADDGLNGWRVEAISKDSNLCIDVNGQKQAIQNYCTGAASQRFQLAGNTDGTYSLRQDTDTDQCLAVSASRTDNYAPIAKTACGAAPSLAQKWKVERPSAGSYVLKSANSNKCLVVSGASKTAGANLVQYDCAGGTNEKFAFTKFVAGAKDAEYSGAWSAPIDLHMVASSIAVLPDKTVMYWSGTGTHSFHGNGTGTYYGHFDPTSNLSTRPMHVDFGLEAFCPALVMAADGRVMIVGGGGKQANRDRVFSYDFRTSSWKQESSLTIPRWYNSGVVMGGGEIFTIGGDGDGNPIHTNMEKLGEYWLPNQDTDTPWTLLTGTGEPAPNPAGSGEYGMARLQYYRRLALAPDGRILEFGGSPTMRWHTVDGNDGKGSTTVASYRAGDTDKTYDTNAQGAASAQYSQSKILMAGGSIAFGEEDPKKVENQAEARQKSFIIDLNKGTAQRAADMHYPRYQANAITMPDGQVFMTGGSPKSLLFNNVGAIVAPEMYDPATNTWSTLAPAARPRIYHSVAALLPDGRVWVGGGGQCGDCVVNESTAEIFTPPVLLRGKPRPIITEAPAQVGFGKSFSVTASIQNGQIKRFTLVRMSATTHSINTDQRLLEVGFSAANGKYELTAPANGNIAPPGYYMLFAISQDGVYSVSSIVKLGA